MVSVQQDHQIARTSSEAPRTSSSHSADSLSPGDIADTNKPNDGPVDSRSNRAKKKVKKIMNKAKDTTQGVKKSIGGSTPNLCTACEQIPFEDCLPERDGNAPETTPEKEPLVFCMSLSQVLSCRGWCKFCGLLFRSSCQSDNDLLKAGHIKDHLDSQELKEVDSFAGWVEKFPNWKRIVAGEDSWPFGYTVDQQQAAKNTLTRAKELFQSAEHEDINTKSLIETIDNSYKKGNDAGLAAQAMSIGVGVMGITNVGKSQETQKFLAGAQLAASQLAILTTGKRHRLPCLFVIRAYRKDEPKAGVLSVRVYGHGRAALAPLKEICHFSLRFEGSGEPRITKEQIWYGRTLGRRVDAEFFKTCTEACQKLHKACNTFPWQPITQELEIYRHFPFRLIDVNAMNIMETDFEEVVKPMPHQWHLDYVALSYTWGIQAMSHSRSASSSAENGQSLSRHARTNSYLSSWRNDPRFAFDQDLRRPVPPTQLTSKNIDFLLQEGSLNNETVYIPKTIRDAIEVVRKVGQKYLWVDSLCIIQEENHPDNEANISRMGRIYGEALFTVVAADSLHADSGLKGVSSPRDPYDQILESEIIQGTQIFLPVSVPPSYLPWDSRAWCFQEKLLSRRMLVFSGGFAVWHCGGGIWREDVNALDGDGGSNSFAWPRLILVPKAPTNLERAGLEIREEDGSIRLYRSPGIDQYISTVEDFSGRDIGDSWRVLDAFKGVQSLLESSALLNSPFRYGLPAHFMDIALLWQPKTPARRRPNGTISRYSPPSWSWAGWEADSTAASKGAAVYYDKPYEIQADDIGMLQRMTKFGEERLRPLKGVLWGKVTNLPKVKQLGMFSLPGMDAITLRDWEAGTVSRAKPPRLVLENAMLSDRHLVLQTQVATICLGGECFRVRNLTKVGNVQYCREVFMDTKPPSPLPADTSISEERWIIGAESGKKSGVVKLNAGNKATLGTGVEIEAVLLSEAQFLGNETKIDVSGYPLYNIMVIRRTHARIAERVGLGRMFKYAWKRAGPADEVVVLQ